MSILRKYSDLLFTQLPHMWRNIGWRGVTIRLTQSFYRKVPCYYLEIPLSDLGGKGGNRNDFVTTRATSADIRALHDLMENGNPRIRRDLESQRRSLLQGFQNLHLTRTHTGELCFIQWIVYPAEFDAVAKLCGRIYYPLKPYQVMIENAYAFPDFRGFGAAAFGTVELLKLAQKLGYRQCCTYIPVSNVGSLNFAVSIGFKVRKLLWEYKILGITSRKLT